MALCSPFASGVAGAVTVVLVIDATAVAAAVAAAATGLSSHSLMDPDRPSPFFSVGPRAYLFPRSAKSRHSLTPFNAATVRIRFSFCPCLFCSGPGREEDAGPNAPPPPLTMFLPPRSRSDGRGRCGPLRWIDQTSQSDSTASRLPHHATHSPAAGHCNTPEPK